MFWHVNCVFILNWNVWHLTECKQKKLYLYLSELLEVELFMYKNEFGIK